MDINSVINSIKKITSLKFKVAKPLPSPIVLLGRNRSGMSAIRVTNRVLEQKQKLGLPVGTRDNGEANYDDQMIQVIVKEVIREIKENAVIQVSIDPSTAIVTAAGGNSGGPVTVAGTVVNIQTGVGVMQ